MKTARVRDNLWDGLAWLVLAAVLVFFLAAAAVSHAAEAAANGLTQADALMELVKLAGMWGSGLTGWGATAAVLALLMRVIKTEWARGYLWERIPAQWRSAVPLALGAVTGAVEALSTGGPLVPGLIRGAVVLGGAQQVIYEQTKGNALGGIANALLQRVLPVPK